MREKIFLGNRFARWTIKLLRLGIKRKMVVWLENPATSCLFRLPIGKRLVAEEPSLRPWVVDYCRFFMRWFSNTILGAQDSLQGGSHSFAPAWPLQKWEEKLDSSGTSLSEEFRLRLQLVSRSALAFAPGKVVLIQLNVLALDIGG